MNNGERAAIARSADQPRPRPRNARISLGHQAVAPLLQRYCGVAGRLAVCRSKCAIVSARQDLQQRCGQGSIRACLLAFRNSRTPAHCQPDGNPRAVPGANCAVHRRRSLPKIIQGTIGTPARRASMPAPLFGAAPPSTEEGPAQCRPPGTRPPVVPRATDPERDGERDDPVATGPPETYSPPATRDRIPHSHRTPRSSSNRSVDERTGKRRPGRNAKCDCKPRSRHPLAPRPGSAPLMQMRDWAGGNTRRNPR